MVKFLNSCIETKENMICTLSSRLYKWICKRRITETLLGITILNKVLKKWNSV